MDKRRFVKLQCVFGAGSPAPGKLLRHFGSVAGVFAASVSELKDAVRSNKISQLIDGNYTEADRIIKLCKANRIDIITYEDSRFPERLRNIPDPPAVLYVKGQLPVMDDEVAIAVVGPRKPDTFGVKAAFSLSARLAKAGAVIVSGGALGVDSEAHLGALWASAKTVAVLGCGHLYPYLAENEELRQKIAQNGAVVSEYPPEFPANRTTFPVRNRIMSGLSLGTVVVQAKQRSGSLITARHAAEQGRDVFVIPGSPADKMYTGSNLLLKDGAKPVLTAVDVLEEYVERYPHKLDLNHAFSKEGQDISQGFRILHGINEKQVNNEPEESISPEDLKAGGVGENAQLVLAALRNGADSPDLLAEYTKLGSAEIITALTELEIFGYASAVAGGRYRANR